MRSTSPLTIRLAIASLIGPGRASCPLPSVLLLDEPYQGFDWETYLRFWALVEELKRSGKAILVISHLIFERKKFDHILHLQEGHIHEETV